MVYPGKTDKHRAYSAYAIRVSLSKVSAWYASYSICIYIISAVETVQPTLVPFSPINRAGSIFSSSEW